LARWLLPDGWLATGDIGMLDDQGRLKITDRKKSTHLVLAIQGELSLPLPGMMKMVVTPVVEGEFEKMVEQYIDNLTAHFGGEV
jgi:acyl-CoA synthetase (AMP-forming)/AMP-acid ligase II